MNVATDGFGEAFADEDAGERGGGDFFLEALEEGEGAGAEFAGGAGVGEWEEAVGLGVFEEVDGGAFENSKHET